MLQDIFPQTDQLLVSWDGAASSVYALEAGGLPQPVQPEIPGKEVRALPLTITLIDTPLAVSARQYARQPAVAGNQGMTCLQATEQRFVVEYLSWQVWLGNCHLLHRAG